MLKLLLVVSFLKWRFWSLEKRVSFYLTFLTFIIFTTYKSLVYVLDPGGCIYLCDSNLAPPVFDVAILLDKGIVLTES